MRWLTSAAAWLLLSVGVAADAAVQPFPERGRSAVVDAAGVIPDDVEGELNAEIVAWSQATGRQLVVATVPNLQGQDLRDYSNRLFRHWGLGRAEENDGVLLLLAPAERQVRIEVGYGLEPVLTDAVSGAIIRETIRPALRSGDVAIALGAGAKRIMAAAGPAAGEPIALTNAGGSEVDPPFPYGFFLFLTVMIVGPILLFWRARRKRRTSLRTRDERRYATVPRAEHRASSGVSYSDGTEALAALTARASTSSDTPSSAWSSSNESYGSSWESSSSSSSSSDSGFDSGGGSSGGGGADSNY
jgi:uncharacterized protein